MALGELILKYNPESDHLFLQLPDRLALVEDSAALFVLAGDEDVDPTALTLFVGCEEDSDVMTGEVVSIECLNFYRTYLSWRQKLITLVTSATPARTIEGDKVSYSLAGVDLSVIDEDLKQDKDNALLIALLPRLLDEFYFEAAAHQICNMPIDHEQHQGRRITIDRVIASLS